MFVDTFFMEEDTEIELAETSSAVSGPVPWLLLLMALLIDGNTLWPLFGMLFYVATLLCGDVEQLEAVIDDDYESSAESASTADSTGQRQITDSDSSVTELTDGMVTFKRFGTNVFSYATTTPISNSLSDFMIGTLRTCSKNLKNLYEESFEQRYMWMANQSYENTLDQEREYLFGPSWDEWWNGEDIEGIEAST
jgi:hypothetical protein